MYLIVARPWPSTELCFLVVFERLVDFFFRIHHEWTVLNNWLGAGKASQIWEQSQRPLKAAGLAIVLLILLQLLGAVLGTLNHIPMLPRLLELVGLIWLGIFAAKKLVRSSDRKTFISQLSGAWNSFSGRP